MKRLVMNLRARRTELALILVALTLYVPAIGWGIPSASNSELIRPWSPDDIAPLGPLTEVHNTFIQAKPDRNLHYPLLQYLLVAAAYSPYLLYLFATGGLSHPSPVFPYGMLNPAQTFRVLSLIARSVTLLMAAGTIVAAYQVGRALWDRSRGILAAIFVMLLYPMFYYSRTGNLDVPALFWSGLGLAVFARILRDGHTVGRGIWLGVFAAMAAGTKDPNAGLFILLGLILLPLHFRRTASDRKPGQSTSRWAAPLATMIAGLAVYAVSSGFIFRPERYFAHVAYITGARSDSPILPGQPATWQGYNALLKLVGELVSNTMSAPLLIVALAGIALAAVKDRLSLALLLSPLGLFLMSVAPTRFVQMRYVLPIGFVLACYAAFLVGAGLRARHMAVRISFGILAVALCTLSLARGADLTHAMLRDSRYATADWFSLHARPGDQIEYFGPAQKLPPLRTDVAISRAVYYGGTIPGVRYTAEDIQSLAQAMQQRSPNFVMIMPDASSLEGYPYGTTCPVEFYDLLKNGSLGYQLVAYFETPALFAWAQRPPLDYPVVNPPVQIFARTAGPIFTEASVPQR